METHFGAEYLEQIEVVCYHGGSDSDKAACMNKGGIWTGKSCKITVFDYAP